MSWSTTKPTKSLMRLVKTKSSLRIHAVLSQSSLSSLWVARPQRSLQADSEDSDQTSRIHANFFVVRTCLFVAVPRLICRAENLKSVKSKITIKRHSLTLRRLAYSYLLADTTNSKKTNGNTCDVSCKFRSRFTDSLEYIKLST